jgi:hypothetical protein
LVLPTLTESTGPAGIRAFLVSETERTSAAHPCARMARRGKPAAVQHEEGSAYPLHQGGAGITRKQRR